MKYNDFTLILEKPDDNRWVLRIETDTQGESEESIQIEIPTDEVIEEMNKRLDRRETDRDYLKTLGQDLFGRLMVEMARDKFHLCLGEVRNDSTRGLRLRFRALEPEIAALPWELLYSDMDRAFIGTRVKTPIVRYVDMPMPSRSLSVPYPVNVLVVVPKGDDDTAPIDSEAERQVIDKATARFKGKVQVTYLADQFEDGRVTWLRLIEHLSVNSYHCVHYVGHGYFEDDTGHILLDREEEEGAEFIDEQAFAEVLTNVADLKLVLLNACETAAQSSSKPLAGVATHLVRSGVPAVLAMQFGIYDKAAIAFSRVFYQSLFVGNDRGRVDVAVARGRQALGAKYAGEREIAAPVLFTHAKTNVLMMPEGEGVLANVPLDGDRLDALEDARNSTADVEEKARFTKQIKIGRIAVRAALFIGVFAFLLSTVRFLDVFGLDTRFELTMMSLGYAETDHQVSDQLRIVTIPGEHLGLAGRREQAIRAVGVLTELGVGTVALDMFYSVANGEFATEPEIGRQLVSSITESTASVVIGAVAASGDALVTPDAMRIAAAGLGFVCYEKRDDKARSLPISAKVEDVVYPSFALATVGAHRDATVSGGFDANSAEPYLSIAGLLSQRFDVSEYRQARSSSNECEVIRRGSQVAHRFVSRTPNEMLLDVTATLNDLSTADPDDYAGKLVVVGVTGAGDIVADITGQRDGIFWQAEAINNLLLDKVIKPVGELAQLVAMLIVAVVAMIIALRLRSRKTSLWASMIALWILLIAAMLILYGRFGLLLNPAYYMLATIAAWAVASRFGQRWLA